MDPNLFAIDGERLLEVMLAIVIMSFMVDRALAVRFENRWFVNRFASSGVKEPISLLAALAVCRGWDFAQDRVLGVHHAARLHVV